MVMIRNADDSPYDHLFDSTGEELEELSDAIALELETWDADTLINYAKQELGIEFPEEFEERVDLIGEMVIEIIKDPDQRENWSDELKYYSPEELYG